MRIAINLRLLNPGKIGGMEGYVRNLIKYFLELDKELRLLLFVTENNTHTLDYDIDRVTKINIPAVGYGHEILTSIIENEIELYFCPLLILEPVIVHIPTAINIPDVQHEYFPEFFSQEILDWRKLQYKASVSAASAVMTLSQFSAASIIEKIGAPLAKVFSVYIAADDDSGAHFNPATELAVRKKYGLPEIYGYFPANTWPHKNHATLLKALKIYKSKYGPVPKIVFTGAEDSGHKDLERVIKEEGLKDDILFLGYIAKNEMQYVYKCASFLVFPSLFEGFGMPVIEAMSAGCPVICSNTTSLPEVAEDAAVYFDPLKPEEIADAINTVVSEPELREKLIERGIEQAKKFSWERTAKETLSIFKELVSPPAKAVLAQPLVSVVTPSYNQGEFIEETVLSVLGQDYSNIEYLVMDAGSKDQTVEILNKYDNRIKWVSEPDKGQADAVNKGFRAARGEILGWLNSDDTYLPGVVQKVVDYFAAHPEVVMVYGNAYYTDKDSLITGRYLSEPFSLNRLAENCFICQPSVFLRAEALKEVGEVDVELRTCMDFDLWIRIGKKFAGRIGFLEDYLATSRMYEENKTLSLREKVYHEIIATVTKHFGYVADTWKHGYIVEIINGIYMTRHDRFRPRVRKILNWLYVIRFLLKIRSIKSIIPLYRSGIIY